MKSSIVYWPADRRLYSLIIPHQWSSCCSYKRKQPMNLKEQTPLPYRREAYYPIKSSNHCASLIFVWFPYVCFGLLCCWNIFLGWNNVKVRFHTYILPGPFCCSLNNPLESTDCVDGSNVGCWNSWRLEKHVPPPIWYIIQLSKKSC